MSYVYIKHDRKVGFTVGFFRPYSGLPTTWIWEEESTWITKDQAAERVNYLNGGEKHEREYYPSDR